MPFVTLNQLFKIAIRGIIIGCFATIVMDLWTLTLFFVIGHPVDWGTIGQIVGYMFQGQFILPDVSHYQQLKYQNAIGWMTHYSVGFVYAGAYELIVLHGLRYRADLFKAIVFSWALMVFPLCVLSPLFGNGFFYMDASSPLYNVLYTISCHTLFGVGLWLGSLISTGIRRSTVLSRWVVVACLVVILGVVVSGIITVIA